MKHRKSVTTLTGLIVIMMAAMGCQRGSSEWDNYIPSFIEGFFRLYPSYAAYQGRHDYDGLLPDWSPAGLDRQAAWLQEQQEQARRFSADDLNDRQRFEQEYLLATVEGLLFWLDEAQGPYRNPFYYDAWFTPNSFNPLVYITREYAPLDERLRAYTHYARNLPLAVSQIRTNLQTPIPRTYIAVGHTTYGGLADFLETDVPSVFTGVEDDTLQAAFRQANDQAVRALRELDAWLTAQESEATDDFALGPELFSRMLWATERVDVSLEELEAIGRRDLERNLAALQEACSDLAAGKSIPECVAMVMNDKPALGPIEEAHRQLTELKQFLVEKDLVTIPGTEEALVKETPSFMRWNFAMIEIPGPYEDGMPSFYYISPPDPSWSEEVQQAYIPGSADLLFTSVHEVWPGHFLHYLHSNRVTSKVGQIFGSYAFGEGWAHYAEEMMCEAGLADGDPAVQVGQLLNALLRNVRYLSAIEMHTQGMTVEESEEMFREVAFLDPGNARQQAVRGTFDPGFLNYTLGKLMVRKLRADWTAERGGRPAWKEFHDQFLSYGSPPIPLVRTAMLGEAAGSAL